MGLDQILHHGEADPAPTHFSARTAPEKALEDPVKLFGQDSLAGVGDLEASPVAVGADEKGDRSSCRGELGCVHKEVCHYLAQAGRGHPRPAAGKAPEAPIGRELSGRGSTQDGTRCPARSR